MAYKITIRTAQNVAIEYEVANVWDRIVAFLIDGLIIIAYLFFSMLIIGSIASEGGKSTILISVTILIYLPVMFYSLLFEVFNNGQSPGKMIMKIQVVSISGDPVTVGQYMLRWLFRIIDFYIISKITSKLFF